MQFYKNRSQKMFFLMVLFCCFFLSCNNDTSKTTTPKSLTILQFTDIYEHTPIAKGKRGGAARVKTVIDQYAEQNPLVIFSGDTLGGSFFSQPSQGKAAIDIFNLLGVDYAVLGNHEFDFGMDITTKRVRDSHFKWLISNLKDKTTKKPVAGALEYEIFEWNGIKIGIMGLISKWLDYTSVGKNVEYEDFVVKAKKLVKQFQDQNVELIIAVTHMSEASDTKLAESVPEIDLILGGHDHHPIKKMANDTLIYKAGSDYINVGKIEVKVSADNKTQVTAKHIPITDQIAEDATTKQLIASYLETNNQKLSDQIGQSEVPLDTTTNTVRKQEAAIGNLIADIMREITHADIAIMNGGGIRSNQVYPAGLITQKTIANILPFPNKIVSVEVTGKILKEALEHGVNAVENLAGRFPHVSGMTFTVDLKQPAGKRVSNIMINGKVLEDNKTYTLALNDFMAGGGDGYTMFKGAKMITTPEIGPLISYAVSEYIKKKQIISPKLEGRIQIKK